MSPQEHLVSQHHLLLEISARLVDTQYERAIHDWVRSQSKGW